MPLFTSQDPDVAPRRAGRRTLPYPSDVRIGRFTLTRPPADTTDVVGSGDENNGQIVGVLAPTGPRTPSGSWLIVDRPAAAVDRAPSTGGDPQRTRPSRRVAPSRSCRR